jgi:hypothetical protein
MKYFILVSLYLASLAAGKAQNADIFLAYRLDDTWTNWSEPINLGSWINTTEWDAYFSMTAQEDYVYFASYKNAVGDADIFRVKLTDEMRKAFNGK